MSISRAQPIQFWAVDEQTYNEKEVCGIAPDCFCQPFNCDDHIVIVAAEEMMESPEDYTFIIINQDGAVVYVPTVNFTSTGILSGTLSDIAGLCEGVYQFLLVQGASARAGILLPPNQWESGGLTEPIETATKFIYTTAFANVNIARQSGIVDNVTTPNPITVVVTTAGGGPSDQVDVRFEFRNSSLDVVWSGSVSIIGMVTSESHAISFAKNPSFNNAIYLYIIMDNSFDVVPTFEVQITPNEILQGGQFESGILYKSDCIDIKEDHPCTNLITYFNNSDFAGVPYDNQSPTPELSVRVPSVVFHESFPREDEVQPLSNDTFRRLASTISRKVQAEFGYMPYYMHEKLNLIFMHDHIEIDGTEYVVRDPYEIVDGNKRYPLKMGRVLLTDKNYIERNLL